MKAFQKEIGFKSYKELHEYKDELHANASNNNLYMTLARDAKSDETFTCFLLVIMNDQDENHDQ